MRRTVDAAKREVWRKRLARRQASGLSVAEFCRREGVSEPSFYYWQRRLAEESAAPRQPAFVPVRIAGSQTASLEIEFPNQARVRVPIEMARERLAEILQAVGTTPAHAGTTSERGRC